MDQTRASNLLDQFDKFVARELRTLSEEQRIENELDNLQVADALRDILIEQLGLSEEEVQAAGIVLGLVYMSALTDAYRCEKEGTRHMELAEVGEMTHLITHFAATTQAYVLSLVGMTTVQKVRTS